jgi:hypothetical protein
MYSFSPFIRDEEKKPPVFFPPSATAIDINSRISALVLGTGNEDTIEDFLLKKNLQLLKDIISE